MEYNIGGAWFANCLHQLLDEILAKKKDSATSEKLGILSIKENRPARCSY